MTDNTKPKHYQTKSGRELFDAMEKELLTDEEYKGFLKGNIYKYLHRYESKNGVEDLRKAKVYLERLIGDEKPKTETFYDTYGRPYIQTKVEKEPPTMLFNEKERLYWANLPNNSREVSEKKEYRKKNKQED